MIAKPTVHPLAQHHLADLRNQWGVEPTLEEQLWIIQLCDKVLKPTGDCDLELIGMPQRVGASQTYLWPFTIGAAIWFENCACKWWGDPVQLQRAEAFVLAHARDKETLRRMYNKETAEKEIRAWEKGLDCTLAELLAAIDALYPPQQKIEKKKSRQEQEQTAGIDYAGIVMELEVTTGLPSEYFLWTTSLDLSIDKLVMARAVHAAMMGGGGGGESPAELALADLYLAKGEIVKARKHG